MKPEEITRVLENVTVEQFESAMTFLGAQELEAKVITEGKTPEDMIRIWLDGQRANNPELAAKYPKNPMGKTVKDCWSYIEQLIRKNNTGKTLGCATSFQVFKWAAKYFIDDTIKKEEKAATATVKTSVPAPKVDIAALQAEKEQWEADNKAKIDEWEQKQNAKIDKWDNEHPEDLFGYRPENPFAKEENPYLKMVFPKQAILDKAIEAQKTPAKAAAPVPVETPAAEAEPDAEAVGAHVHAQPPEQPETQAEEGEEIEEASEEELKIIQ